MRYQVILSPYVKDLGKVVDNTDQSLLCNADLQTARLIAGALNVCSETPELALKASICAKDNSILKKP